MLRNHVLELQALVIKLAAFSFGSGSVPYQI